MNTVPVNTPTTRSSPRRTVMRYVAKVRPRLVSSATAIVGVAIAVPTAEEVRVERLQGHGDHDLVFVGGDEPDAEVGGVGVGGEHLGGAEAEVVGRGHVAER